MLSKIRGTCTFSQGDEDSDVACQRRFDVHGDPCWGRKALAAENLRKTRCYPETKTREAIRISQGELHEEGNCMKSHWNTHERSSCGGSCSAERTSFCEHHAMSWTRSAGLVLFLSEE